MENYLQGVTDDLDLFLGGTDSTAAASTITLSDAQATDVDEQAYGAGDSNFIFGVTWLAQSATTNPLTVTS
jgi:hypothetical protein